MISEASQKQQHLFRDGIRSVCTCIPVLVRVRAVVFSPGASYKEKP